MATPTKPKRQFRVVNKGKGKLDITKDNLHEVVGNTEADEYIYSGFLINGVIVIKRVKDSIEEFAQGLTALEADWTNRLTLSYI